jgi:cation:H+ antiporter
MVAALLGILLTMLVLIGLLERRNKAMLRMGYDSIAVLVAYSAGLAAILGGAFAE